MRFVSLQRFEVVPRYRGRPSSRRSRFGLGPSCNTAEGRCPAESLVLAVFRLASTVRGTRRRTHGSHRFARVIHRGLSFHAAFRYPFDEPCTTGPDLLRFRSGNAPGILVPFAVFPTRGSRRLQAQPVTAKAFFRRSSPHAVCWSFSTATFYGCWPPCLSSFQASLA